MLLQWHAPVTEIEHSIAARFAKELVTAIATTSHIGGITPRLDEYDLLAMPAGVRIFFEHSNWIGDNRVTTWPSH
jgi:hypothetical protein